MGEVKAESGAIARVKFSASDLNPSTVRAFLVLVAFAEKNFPADGRIKHIRLCAFGELSSLVVGGGTSKQTGNILKPGLWNHWDGHLIGYKTAGESRIDTADDLAEFLLDPRADFQREELFCYKASNLVDF